MIFSCACRICKRKDVDTQISSYQIPSGNRFRLLKAAIIRPYVSENYISVPIHIITKSMTEVSVFHKVYVNNFTIYKVLLKAIYDCVIIIKQQSV
jgi:hypothetical protein